MSLWFGTLKSGGFGTQCHVKFTLLSTCLLLCMLWGKNTENYILLHYKKCNIFVHSKFVTTISVCGCNSSKGEEKISKALISICIAVGKKI